MLNTFWFHITIWLKKIVVAQNAKNLKRRNYGYFKTKGSVKVFETPFRVFTTGKTNIGNHKELLYLCEVDNFSKKVSKVTPNKSAINYTGGKSKLIPQLLPMFPKEINNFYDVFAGGANVTINVKAKNYFLNDINYKVIQLYELLKNKNYHELVKNIEEIISQYKLSNTKCFGYDFYKTNSSVRVKTHSIKMSYLNLRNDYNNHLFSDEIEPLSFIFLLFTVLIIKLDL